MMKRVIIAGGTGLIGQELCKSLLESGYEVVILSRRDRGAESGNKHIQYASWDGKTVGDWQRWLDGADVVVNLAGENIGAGSWTAERKQRIRSSRVDAGVALTRAIEMTQHKPRVLLQASAIGYYGVTGDQPVTEANPAGTDFLPGICLDWEASTQTVETMGLRRVILRTGIVLSLQGGALPRTLLPIRFFVGGPLGSGQQYWSWIHWLDEVLAMQYLLETETASGAFNLTAPTPVNMNEFGQTTAAVLKRPYWLPAPAFALRLLLGEMSALVLDSQRILPERLLQAGYQFKYTQLRPALQDLCFIDNRR